MPNTKYIQAVIGNRECDLSDIEQINLSCDFLLNDPESWNTVPSNGMSLTFPCTPTNDVIFNTYHNPDVCDNAPAGQTTRNLMPCVVSVNGSIPIISGKSILESATFTDRPESYNVNVVGGNGEWILDSENLTVWDCLSTTPHTFDLVTVQKSWESAVTGGYDSDEAHDFVYAPVRYRQPFQYTNTAGKQVGNDDTVSIYMLRPSISKYWILYRAFSQLGYNIDSQFLNSAFFRRQVMPWTFGDFFDINSQITDSVAFKAAGDIQDMRTYEDGPTTGASGIKIWTGSTSGTTSPSAHGSIWWGNAISGLGPGGSPILTTGGEYIYTGNLNADNHFRMTDTLPPNGFDNFGLYSFDDSTGTMIWTYNPPASLASFIGSNISVNFELNLMLTITTNVSSNAMAALEVTHIFASGSPTVVANASIMPSGGAVSPSSHYPDISGYPVTPTVYRFSVPGLNIGDELRFRVRALEDGGGIGGAKFSVTQAGLLNVNPSATGASNWQYNFATGRTENVYGSTTDNIWQQQFSYLTMTGLQIELGNSVNFQYYDAFRNYKFHDYLGALVEEYDLMIATDPSTKTVKIEPAFPTTVPDYDAYGEYTGELQLDGFYNLSKIVDWSDKLDRNKTNRITNFINANRQIDYNHKQDGSDGGQNIYSARYKGVNIANIVRPRIVNRLIDNGIIAGIPGASRYMLPNRFAKGNTQKSNRMFGVCMHYKNQRWANITGLGSPAPQLITIFPENINDSSASAVTQVFEPKSAFYKGLVDKAGYGGWRFIGDPASPYSESTAIAFNLPYMFGVNYNSKPLFFGGNLDPVLTYSDQLTYDASGAPVVSAGLMRRFHLPRLAIMRNGQLCDRWLRLNLNDVTGNYFHNYGIKIGNGIYVLLGIKGYKPLTDDSCEVQLWKVANVEQTDIDNCFPSQYEIENDPAIVPQYDLPYAQLLLFQTDIPI